MSDKISEPGRIEQDLNQTRTRLDGHLGELQERLTPGQVLDDVMRYFRGREGAEFGRNLLESVRENPIPAAITGIGMTWLMATNGRAANTPGSSAWPATLSPSPRPVSRPPTGGYSHGGYEAMSGRVQAAETSVVRNSNEAEPSYKARIEEARGKAMGLARHAQETSESFSQRILDALSAARDSVTHGTHDLQDRVGGATQNAGHVAGQAGRTVMSTVTESPMLLGALSLAAGAALGVLLPQSEQEEAALGQVAGQARGAARDLAQSAVDSGGNVAQAVVSKGRESAEAHGLTGARGPGALVDAALSGDLSGDAKQVAGDALRAADAAVRKEAPSSVRP